MRGRGTTENPAGRFESLSFERDVDDEQPPSSVKTLFFKDPSRTILSQNQSPDVGFDWSINPYRGCEHGCVYCYARPTHEYLGFSAGLDFESKILIKENAPQLLRAAFASPRYQPAVIAMSGVTDCYQPVERRLGLTRRCLEVFAEYRNPVWIITKNALVTRDIDLLVSLSTHRAVAVLISLTSLDDELCGKMEPRTSRPTRRLDAVSQLAKAGVPVGVNLAPIIPALNEPEIPALLNAAKAAGATFASFTLVRLPYGVKDLFSSWLEEHFPDRKKKVLSQISEMRNGKLNDSRFKSRMRGQGVYAQKMEMLFRLSAKKAGFTAFPTLSTAAFRKLRMPTPQLELFDPISLEQTDYKHTEPQKE